MQKTIFDNAIAILLPRTGNLPVCKLRQNADQAPGKALTTTTQRLEMPGNIKKKTIEAPCCPIRQA
jgi:hypothetical protein